MRVYNCNLAQFTLLETLKRAFLHQSPIRSASFRTQNRSVHKKELPFVCANVCVYVCIRLIRCEAVNHHLTTNLPAHFLKFSRQPFVNNTFA